MTKTYECETKDASNNIILQQTLQDKQQLLSNAIDAIGENGGKIRCKETTNMQWFRYKVEPGTNYAVINNDMEW